MHLAGQAGFRVILTTNGTLLPAREELLLSAPALHKVNISLQSFEANDRGELSPYLSACAGFAEKANDAGKLCALRLWNQNGLDSRNDEIETLLAQHFPKPWPESRRSRKLAERVYLEPGERFDWPDERAEERGRTGRCRALRDQIAVLSDGTVVPCCLDHEGTLALGNLFRQELADMLAAPLARAMREGFERGERAAPLCRRCGYAERFGAR